VIAIAEPILPALQLPGAVSESACTFAIGGDETIGITTRGPRIGPIGVLIVTGGPQYRIGSHRQFVLLARALAAAGMACFRFDLRGMGDGEGGKAEFTALDAELAAARAAFSREVPELAGVVLLGLCDAASASLIHAAGAEAAGVPIRGVVAINPWIRTERSRAAVEVRHHYGGRLLSGEFWRRLLAGKVDLGDAVGGFARACLRTLRGPSANTAGYPERMADGARALGGRVLWILSGQDLTAREFEQYAASSPAWRGMLDPAQARIVRLDDADHTFSRAAQRTTVADAVAGWVRRL
jgi:exosortase A-associated hydrolase 1